MNSEKLAIKRLTEIQSRVSTHFFIKKNGEIITMVPETYIAWHAGISKWLNYRLLNKNSIGIEISNPGHKFGYTSFSKKQITSLIKLSNFLIKKYKIKKNSILGHSDIAPDRKLDPGEKFPWQYLSTKKIGIWHNFKMQKLNSLRKCKVSHSQEKFFLKQLSKFGYPNKSVVVKKKSRFNSFLIKAFQRRFRQKLVNGKIDQECLMIINKLVTIID